MAKKPQTFEQKFMC